MRLCTKPLCGTSAVLHHANPQTLNPYLQAPPCHTLNPYLQAPPCHTLNPTLATGSNSIMVMRWGESGRGCSGWCTGSTRFQCGCITPRESALHMACMHASTASRTLELLYLGEWAGGWAGECVGGWVGRGVGGQVGG